MNKEAGLYKNGKLIKTWDELIRFNIDDVNELENISIMIPKYVTNVDTFVHDYLYLTSIDVDENNTKYCSVDGILFDKEMTTLIKYPEEKSKTNYAMPSSITSIGDNAFAYCTGLTIITMPSNVTSIGNSAFYLCDSLTSITLPEGVTSIGDSAFWDCTSLTSIEIPSSVTSMGKYIFLGCENLKEVIWNSPVRPEMSMFENCPNLERIIYQGKVIEIDNKIKDDKSLETIISEFTEPAEKEAPTIDDVIKQAGEEH